MNTAENEISRDCWKLLDLKNMQLLVPDCQHKTWGISWVQFLQGTQKEYSPEHPQGDRQVSGIRENE